MNISTPDLFREACITLGPSDVDFQALCCERTLEHALIVQRAPFTEQKPPDTVAFNWLLLKPGLF